MSTRAIIHELLTEPIASALERERGTFVEQLGKTDGSVVLLGAGRLGRLCARALRRAEIPLRAFCDRNRQLHGTMVDAVRVMSEQEAAERYGDQALFVIAIWTGTARESMSERLVYVRSLGVRWVVPFPALVWAHGKEEVPFHSFDLPSRILAQRDSLRRLSGELHDDVSQDTLLRTLRQRLLGQFVDFAPAPDQYFPRDFVKLGQDEVLVDGGAFDGDTLMTFLDRTRGQFARYHAFEPDPENVRRLRTRIDQLTAAVVGRVQLHEVALMDRCSRLEFAGNGTIASSASTAGTAPVGAIQVEVEADALDQRLKDERITFLKLDVEGAERKALEGAVATLRRDQPQAAVCVYHEPNDLWEIPLLLRDYLPHHRLSLRQHGIDGWETVCYAVPPERAIGGTSG